MKRVAILGCGPAGLLAAHAANANGCEFQIFSRKVPSALYGCQYLHDAVPGVPNYPARVVTYRLENGTLEDYRRKVYGPEWNGEVSPERLETEHWAWDIRSAYAYLWGRYEGNIQDARINGESQCRRDFGLDRFDVVISTVPRKIWARPGDEFTSAKIWALGDGLDRRASARFPNAKSEQVICNAGDMAWYRLSRVFGHTTVEWPGYLRRPPIPGVVSVEKPLSHNSKSAADFVHVGRYGSWQKGVLTTDAYEMALKVTR